MAWTDIEDSDADTWTFRVGSRFHLDAPQSAKKRVADENGVGYHDLRAKVLNQNGTGPKYVVVVDVHGSDNA